ncbi:MAG: ParB N-terminal domain-containing protein [Acetobacter sp.]|nr:ParB N-terminal domain-containing protein [Acetobacter sp.]
MNRTIQMVSTDELQVDSRYQRPVNEALVGKIASHFNEALFAPLLVAERATPDGHIKFVVDGQHRLEAARLLGFKEVPCFVYSGMSVADEANLFVSQQVASARLTPRDSYKANVFIHNPENIDVMIDKTLHKYGHRIGVHEHDVGGWYAIVTLRETVKKYGVDGLAKVLMLLNELGWTAGRAAKSRLMLVGLGHATKKVGVAKAKEAILANYASPEEFIASITIAAKGRKPTVAVIGVIDNILTA